MIINLAVDLHNFTWNRFSVTAGGIVNGFDVDINKVNTIHSPGNLKDMISRAIETERRGRIGIYYINKKALVSGQNNHKELLLLDVDGFISSILDPDSPVKARRIDRRNLSSSTVS